MNESSKWCSLVLRLYIHSHNLIWDKIHISVCLEQVIWHICGQSVETIRAQIENIILSNRTVYVIQIIYDFSVSSVGNSMLRQVNQERHKPLHFKTALARTRSVHRAQHMVSNYKQYNTWEYMHHSCELVFGRDAPNIICEHEWVK